MCCLEEIISNLRVDILDGGASLLAHIGSAGPPSLFAVDHASSNGPCGRIELRYMPVWHGWVYIWDGKIVQESESVPRVMV